jgi:hypothetical protein
VSHENTMNENGQRNRVSFTHSVGTRIDSWVVNNALLAKVPPPRGGVVVALQTGRPVQPDNWTLAGLHRLRDSKRAPEIADLVAGSLVVRIQRLQFLADRRGDAFAVTS